MLTRLGSSWCVCPDAATPVMMCAKRIGGEAGRSRVQTPSSNVKERVSLRRCRSRRMKAVRFTASWKSTRYEVLHVILNNMAGLSKISRLVISREDIQCSEREYY